MLPNKGPQLGWDTQRPVIRGYQPAYLRGLLTQPIPSAPWWALHHGQPGTVGAVLTCDGITAEVIADNIHLHPAVARLLVRAKGVNTSVLVTDAIRIRH